VQTWNFYLCLSLVVLIADPFHFERNQKWQVPFRYIWGIVTTVVVAVPPLLPGGATMQGTNAVVCWYSRPLWIETSENRLTPRSHPPEGD
jgi:hypothetical protein